MYNRLYSFLKDCNILSDPQYGFVKGKGTADALNKITDIISSAGCKNALSRRPVQERPISAPDSRTTYHKREFCFSHFVVAALRDFKIRFYRHQTCV